MTTKWGGRNEKGWNNKNPSPLTQSNTYDNPAERKKKQTDSSVRVPSDAANWK
jgi:hypothetical protein